MCSKNKSQKPGIITFQMHQDAFSFLGNVNVVTESSDFGAIWGSFFKMGGYDPILPFALDPKPLNLWYTNGTGEKIYFQGLMVGGVDKVPDGYTLMNFPASDFVVVTYEWVAAEVFEMMYEINGGWKAIEALQIPDGYVRYDGPGSPITVIEKENTDTPDGSRYEFWVPIKKAEKKPVPELIKFEIVRLPKTYIVGKEIRYSDAALNNGDNRLPAFWDKCDNENIFAPLEAQTEYIFDSSHAGVFLDWYLGDGDFSYIVGMLMKEGVAVPEGYAVRELAETDVAVGWFKGKFIGVGRGAYDGAGYDLMTKTIKENGRDNSKLKWCMELYNCPRFTVPNENGDTILDIYIPLD